MDDHSAIDRRDAAPEPNVESGTGTGSEADGPQGLGGWLVIVGIGIVLAPLRILVTLVPTYSDMFTTGAWVQITTPGSSVYHPLWQPLLLGEMTVNGLLVIGWIAALFLFFHRKRRFPRLYIALLLTTLVFIPLDAWAVSVVMPEVAMFDSDTVQELSRAVAAAGIWVPYMLVSKRVRATFIE